MIAVGCGSAVNLENSRGQLEFGIQAARMDLWREAQFRFQRALDLDPNSVMALNNLAVAYEGIGEFEKAKEAYRRALQVDRGNEYVQRNYSRFMEFYSRYDEEKKEDEPNGEEPKDEPSKDGEDSKGGFQ